MLRKITGISRYTYNQTIAYLKQPDTKANWMGIKTDILKALPEWAEDAPYQVRSIAVKDACTAVKNAKKKCATHGFQQVSFRSRKAPKQSCYVPKSAVNSEGFFLRKLGKMRFAESLPEVKYDCRLVYEFGKWFICVPVDKIIVTAKTKRPIVSLDPGVRTFLTCFDLEEAGFIADRSWERIFLLCRRLDAIYAQMTKVKARRRQNLKRAAQRLRYRIRCLKDELHFQVASYLCKTYNLIVIPTFSATGMVGRKSRKIGSKTVRAMLSLGHSQFRERLKQVAQIHGSTVVEVNEAYTSKTCTRCGHIHTKLGGSSTFKCPHCGLVISRDINGARNITLRAMLDQTTTAGAVA